jgi:branched-chain amino acid transport system permease protein
MYAYYYASYYYYVPFELGWCFDPLLIAFIGGVGTITGPIIGTIIFVVLREVFTLTLGEAHIIIFGIIFILIVFILPGGLIEGAERSRRFLVRLFR